VDRERRVEEGICDEHRGRQTLLKQQADRDKNGQELLELKMFHPRRKEPTARSNLALVGYVREVVSHTCPDDLLMRFFGWPNIEAIPGRITGRIADHYEQPRDAVIVAFVNRRPVGYTDVARFSSSFDFSVVGGISKQRVVELSQGDYLAKKESIILIGNPGLGKTHVATGLALAACQQGKKVRFFGAAGLVNDLAAK
jgi:hypothetical protein